MDPVADMLVTIKNGYMAKKPKVFIPYSGFKLEIAKVLEKEKIVSSVSKKDSRLPAGNTKIEIELLYKDQKPRIREIKRVSKLGLRVYTKSKNIKQVKGGRGIVIISTPKGVMTGNDAKAKNLGGEVICQIW